MAERVAVLGAGSWGTAVAASIAPRHSTQLWARSPLQAQAINTEHRNPSYLSDIDLPVSLTASDRLDEVLEEASLVIVAVPSHAIRPLLSGRDELIASSVPVVSLVKGIEEQTNATGSQILSAVLPGSPVAVLTGPNLAREVALGLPAACVIASRELQAAQKVQGVVHGPALRAYVSDDVVGCELAGATKNVIAIAAGVLDGMEMGQNARAALIARGLAEMTRFALARGGSAGTIAGLAGVGDLIVTCTSPESRNRRVGLGIAEGRGLGDVLESLHMVAEGVRSCGPLLEMAHAVGVELPICEQVVGLLEGTVTPREALAMLMDRPVGGE
jgi:glycerol-3-phosphate dehydrogenase (NAD(P)+)